ncbi:MAG TPA: hypothetical protein DCE42_14175 [Myxococcales bacterium]|nr:hypothetical protein [Myxococcales bacterium]
MFVQSCVVCAPLCPLFLSGNVVFLECLVRLASNLLFEFLGSVGCRRVKETQLLSHYSRTRYLVVLCALWFVFPSVGRAEASDKSATSSQKVKKYTLKQLLQLAWKRSPMIRSAFHKLEAMKARQQEAFWLAWGVQGTLVALVAPAPEARGNAVSSSTPIPQSYLNFAKYGVWTKFDLNLIWPLYTFGKLSLIQQAAKEGVKLGLAQVRMEKDKLTMLLKQAYYGLQFAESSLLLLEEAEGYLADARKKLKRKDKTAKLKLAVIEAELKTRKLKGEVARRLARSGISRLTGLPLSQKLKLVDEEIDEPEVKMKSLAMYYKLAEKHRPEVLLLARVVKAKQYLTMAQQRAWAPDFFLGGFARFSYSSAADDQLNPFVRDDFHYFDGGVGLGMRFSLDFPIQMARARRAASELASLRSQRKMALIGIRMDIERRYRELRAAESLVSIQRKGRKAANQWISRTMISYSSGLVELKEVTEALLAVAKARFGYLDSLYQFNLSIARLSRSVGIDITNIPEKNKTKK